MAISVMKRVVILAEQANKELLLESLQELKQTEIVPFDSEEFDDDIFFDGTTQGSEDSKLNDYRLSKVEESIDFLKQYVTQPSLVAKMREKRKIYSLKQLEETVNSMKLDSMLRMVDDKQSTLSRLQNSLTELEEHESFLRRWVALDYSSNSIKDLSYFDVIVGSIDTEDSAEFIAELGRVTKELLIQEVYSSDDDSGYMLVFPKDLSENIHSVINRSSFDELDYHYENVPKDELSSVLETRAALITELSELRKSLKTDKQLFSNLNLAQEYYLNLIERDKASQLLVNSHHLFVLKGWMVKEDISDTLVNVHHVIGEENMAVFTYDVDFEKDDMSQVPVKLKNNAFNRAFESLTLQYGTPKYNSVDPTPFYSIFQVLFFGMMSADLGYGLLLFIATAIPIFFFELSDTMKTTLTSFNYMSVGTMLVGIFFGSFFGFELPFSAMNVSTQVIEVMIFSVAVGFVHMIVGYSLKFYLTMKEKDYASMYLDSLQWILILLGTAVLAINILLNVPILNTVGLVLILGNIAGMFIVNMFTASNPIVGFGQGLFGLIDTAGLVGDIVSYTRLTALAVSGANIGMAFNLIVGLFPPIIRFTLGIVLFLALHALNIFISYLGAYVHSMRLQFVEFFGKFYETGGKAFKPLKPREKEVWIQKDYNN